MVIRGKSDAVRTLLRDFVLGEFGGHERAALDVACLDFGEVLPLFGQVVLRENSSHRAEEVSRALPRAPWLATNS